MKLAAAVGCVLVAAGVASATPLEPLWTTKVGCSWGTPLIAWRDALAWITKDKLQRLDRATGKVLPPIKLGPLRGEHGEPVPWGDFGQIEHVLGDLLVIDVGHAFVIVDGVTGKVQWRGDQGDHDGGLPRLDIADRDLIWTHPASLGPLDPPVFLERRAIATGKVVWRADAVPHSGQESWVGSDDRRVYLQTSPDMIGNTVELAAFDLASGTRLWSHAVVTKSGNAGPFTVDGHGHVLAFVNGEGLRSYDGATGAQLPTLPLAPITVARTFLFERGQAYVGDDDHVVALDLATGKVRWQIDQGGELLLVGTALYAWDADMVRALDPTDGHQLAWYGTTGSRLSFAGVDARAPAIVMCEGQQRLFALDPTGTVTPPEHATVTGTLVCATCDRRHRAFPPLQVSLGDATAKTSATGRFSIAVWGRGALPLGFDLPPLESPIAWQGDSRIVHLRGKRTYPLGTIRVRKDCGPLEEC